MSEANDNKKHHGILGTVAEVGAAALAGLWNLKVRVDDSLHGNLRNIGELPEHDKSLQEFRERNNIASGVQLNAEQGAAFQKEWTKTYEKCLEDRGFKSGFSGLAKKMSNLHPTQKAVAVVEALTVSSVVLGAIFMLANNKELSDEMSSQDKSR